MAHLFPRDVRAHLSRLWEADELRRSASSAHLPFAAGAIHAQAQEGVGRAEVLGRRRSERHDHVGPTCRSGLIYLRYLKSLLLHKWFVFLAGRKTVPLWRLLVHDFSKFMPQEFPVYARRFGSGRGGKLTDKNADPLVWWLAWNHHWHRNTHHWEYWIRFIKGEHEAIEMPKVSADEMIADWRGASRAYTGSWDLTRWYGDTKDTMILHPDTRTYVESVLGFENTSSTKEK